MQSLEPELRHLVVNLCQLAVDFDAKADLYLDLGVASVKAMELLMELEERYSVSVPDEEFVLATSLERLASMMQALLAQKA